jgi:hypothetical protein
MTIPDTTDTATMYHSVPQLVSFEDGLSKYEKDIGIYQRALAAVKQRTDDLAW